MRGRVRTDVGLRGVKPLDARPKYHQEHRLFIISSWDMILQYLLIISNVYLEKASFSTMAVADPGCILCIHGYSQHIRQKVKENQYLLLLSS